MSGQFTETKNSKKREREEEGLKGFVSAVTVADHYISDEEEDGYNSADDSCYDDDDYEADYQQDLKLAELLNCLVESNKRLRIESDLLKKDLVLLRAGLKEATAKLLPPMNRINEAQVNYATGDRQGKE